MNQSAFFHDMTLDYLRPAEPDIGRITDFRFRCAHGDASQVHLVCGSEHKKMKLSETDNGFEFRFAFLDFPLHEFIGKHLHTGLFVEELASFDFTRNNDSSRKVSDTDGR